MPVVSNLEADVRAPSAPPRGRRGVGRGLVVLIVALCVVLGHQAWRLGQGQKVLYSGYDLRLKDLLTDDPEARALIAQALEAINEGREVEARQLLETAVRTDEQSPISVALLVGRLTEEEPNRAQALFAEARRRAAGRTTPYVDLLLEYFAPTFPDDQQVLAVTATLLERRPGAWRFRLRRAHVFLAANDRESGLNELKRIDPALPDPVLRALILADRASLGDLAGAEAGLSLLSSSSGERAYLEARLAATSGNFELARRRFDEAGNLATKNYAEALVERCEFGAVAASAALRDWSEARDRLLTMRNQKHEGGTADRLFYVNLALVEVETWLGNPSGADAAGHVAQLIVRDWNIRTESKILELVASRRLGRPFVSADRLTPRVPPDLFDHMVAARHALLAGDRAEAERFFDLALKAGVESSRLLEEARLLSRDLGRSTVIPPRPDPIFPLLRSISYWAF